MKKQGFVRKRSNKELIIRGAVNSLFCTFFVSSIFLWYYLNIVFVNVFVEAFVFLVCPIICMVLLARWLISTSLSGFFTATLHLIITFVVIALPLFAGVIFLLSISSIHEGGWEYFFAGLLFIVYIGLSIFAWIVALIITWFTIRKHRKVKPTELHFKELSAAELTDDMLLPFNRYQEVNNDWIPTESGEYKLISRPHTEDWSKDRKREKVKELRTILNNGGKLFCAYDKDKLVGFAAIDGILLGSEKQYIELVQLHVTYKYRGQKIGKQLFKLCTEAAKNYGCSKLYIVASTAEESQAAYKRLGCVYAAELIPHLHEKSPGDVHLEYVL